jgi:hypothetical protein
MEEFDAQDEPIAQRDTALVAAGGTAMGDLTETLTLY